MVTESVEHKCGNGHRWFAQMYFELGGWFYVEESDAACPKCGLDVLESGGGN